MKKLLLSTLAVLALSGAVQTASAGEVTKFVIGEVLTVVACTVVDAVTLQTLEGDAVCVVAVTSKRVSSQ